MTQGAQTGALLQPGGGDGVGGEREVQERGDIYPQLIHVAVW